MNEVQTFWHEVDSYVESLQTWEKELPSLEDVRVRHRRFRSAIDSTIAPRIMADPRNISRVVKARNAIAPRWSFINSELEYIVAKQMVDECHTYEDFKRLTGQHWLFPTYANMMNAEKALYEAQGMNMKGLKICSIGPGAMPSTALALQDQGASLTVVDMYGPACQWCTEWFSRFFPGQDWKVIQAAGQDISYEEFDLVIVASMLAGKKDVLQAIDNTARNYVQIRSTSGVRPMSLLLSQVAEEDLNLLTRAEFVAESKPPMTVGTYSLLYRYPGKAA